MARINPIPVIAAHDIGSIDRFYERLASQPLIVRGCYGREHPLNQLDLDALQRLMGERLIHVYGEAAGAYSEVPASAIFDGVRGRGEPCNVVDFYLAGTPLATLFDVPPFLRHNWFLGYPAQCDQYEKSLVVSPSGAFTPLHLDSYAMQGWMYLIAGRKTWTCYAPSSVGAAFDPVEKRFFDSRRDRPEVVPALAGCDRFEGEIGAGDLLYFPAGWIHEVATHATSYGVGGSVLNDYQIVEHMEWWLWEREHGLEGSLDLARVIDEMPDGRHAGDDGRRRAARALELCRQWEAARHTGSWREGGAA